MERGRSYHRQFGPRPRQFFVPYNGKIADITHADVLKHTLTLANAAGTGAIAGETRKIVVVYLGTYRAAGVGLFVVYPNEGAVGMPLYNDVAGYPVGIVNGSQRLQYSLSAANDDYDLYCWGYWVEA